MYEELICPHCDNVAIEVSENPSYLPWVDGDTTEITCEYCKKELEVKCNVTKVEWKFVDEYGEEIEHQDY